MPRVQRHMSALNAFGCQRTKGAKVLGNIRVGRCSRIAAGSVVLEEVPPCKTVAGVPARIVGEAGCSQPSMTMDHLLRRAVGGEA